MDNISVGVLYMYFDIDCQIEISESRLEEAFASAAREISTRRGRVIAMSRDILVFSAPFWRVNGLLYFFVQQLPIGVSHGVLQVIRKNGVCVVRSRISLLWLRICITTIVLLLMATAFKPTAGDKTIIWALLLTSIVVGVGIYAVAIVETRRYFNKLLLGKNKGVCVKKPGEKNASEK